MPGFSTELFILGLLLAVNGLFAMAEVAIVSARKARLKQMANEGLGGAQAALDLASQPTRFLSTVQLGVTVCGILAGALGGSTLAYPVAAWLGRFPSLAHWSESIAFAAVLGLITFLSLVVGELVPKRIALSNPESIARFSARPLQSLSRAVSPVISLLSAATDLLLRPLGLNRRRETPVTDEEVNILVEQGMKAGAFHKAEKEMIEGVLRLDQLHVTAIMTPRPKIIFLNIDDPEDVNWRKIVASGHSHFPVYQDNRDQLLGMVAVKALWAHSAIGIQTSLKNLLTPPLVVPETMNCVQLLESFKKSGRHTALIADEFGGIQGMVTLIDVLEAIVGDLPAQGQHDQPQARQREDGTWLIDATLATGALKSILQIDALPQEQEAEYQTLGGLVMTQFGRIPAIGDRFDWEGWRFQVTDMDRHRVDKVAVTRLPLGSEKQATG
jgi:putative hemolysin